MTQYSTDFSNYASAAAPSDWTLSADTANVTFVVAASGGNIRGKVLQAKKTSAPFGVATWNAIDGDANRATVEILCRIRFANNVLDTGRPAPGGRIVDPSTSLDGYFGQFTGTAWGTNGLCVVTRRYLNGVSTLSIVGGQGATFTWAANTWYWYRFQLSGNNQRHRVWTGTMADEPGTWNVQWTNSEVTAAGGVGVWMPNADSLAEFDWFSVGTNGDAAPGPSIGLTSHTVTDITSSGATIGITSDSTDGTLYWYVSTSVTPPTEANLKAGTGAVAYGSDATPTAGANTAAVTGLSANATYYRHWFQESSVYKSSIATSTGFTTLAGVGEDPALRLDVLGGSRELLDTDTGALRTAGSAEYIVLGGTAGSRTITKQGTVAINNGTLADITDGVSLAGIDDTFKVVLIVGNDDQGVFDATVVDRNA